MTKRELVDFTKLLLGQAAWVSLGPKRNGVRCVVVSWPGMRDFYAEGANPLEAAVNTAQERARRMRLAALHGQQEIPR